MRQITAEEECPKAPASLLLAEALNPTSLRQGRTVMRRGCAVQVNGSGIRAWWIRHHYWSIATCMLVLTLPVDSPKVQLFVKKWVWWSCWQVCTCIPACHTALAVRVDLAIRYTKTWNYIALLGEQEVMHSCQGNVYCRE